MNSVKETFGNFGEGWVAFKGFVYGAFVFLEIDQNVVQLLAILMAVDTILGIAKTIVLGEKFSFKKLIWGMITKVSVLIVPMVLALTAKALSFDFTWFVNVVLDILVVSEAFSAITNVISIKEKRELENTDFITQLLKRIRSGLKGLIDNFTNQIDPDGEKENNNDKTE
jgi:hypothetical protein